MTVELGVVISVFSVIIAFMAYLNNQKKDNKSEGKEYGTMQADITYIKRLTEDSRVDQKAMDTKLNDINLKVARIDESVKSAHKRIDEIEIKRKKGE